MIIRYVWENMPISEPINDSLCSTPLYRHTTRTIEYEFETPIRPSDIIAYLMPIDEKDKTTAHFYMSKVIEFIIESGDFNLESLENDYCFKDFLKDRYEKMAIERFRQENGDY